MKIKIKIITYRLSEIKLIYNTRNNSMKYIIHRLIRTINFSILSENHYVLTQNPLFHFISFNIISFNYTLKKF